MLFLLATHRYYGYIYAIAQWAFVISKKSNDCFIALCSHRLWNCLLDDTVKIGKPSSKITLPHSCLIKTTYELRAPANLIRRNIPTTG